MLSRGFLCACIVAVSIVVLTGSASAGYQASNALGQLSLTSACANEAPVATGLAGPLDMDIDSVNHRLFVGDISNHRVLIFNLNVSNILVDSTADYVLGQQNFTTCDLQAVSAQSIGSPRGVVYDATNDLLYVTDATYNRVLVFDTATITNNEAAINVLGQPDFTSSSAAVTRSGITGGNSLELDGAGRLFVAGGANRVSVWDVASITNGEDMISVLGQPDFTSSSLGAASVSFYNPHGVAYDTTNNFLFVADDLNGRLQVFDVASASVGEGALYSLGTGTTLTSQGLGRNLGVAYDNTGHRLFSADYGNNMIRIWDFDLIPLANNSSASFVLGTSDFTVIGSASLDAAHLGSPHGLEYDVSTDRLYVTDPTNQRILIFDTASIVNEEDAVGVVGQTIAGTPTFTKGGANDGPSSQGLAAPHGVALDTVRHRLFVADITNHRVLVHQLDSNNELIDETADWVLGQSSFTGSTSGLSQSAFAMTTTTKLGFDETNNRLFVAVYAQNRVLVYDLSGGITNGMNASYVLGQADFTSSSAADSQSGLRIPVDAEYDSVSKYLYITELSGHRVKVYNLSGGITSGMNAYAVLGQSTWSGAGSGTTSTTMFNPYGACLDVTGRRLFVAELSNRRLSQFDITTVASGQAAVGVLGQANLTSNTSQTTVNGLAGPTDCVYDSVNDRVYAIDFSNKRIIGWDVATLTDGEDAVVVIGQDDFISASAGTTAQRFTGGVRQAALDATNGHFYATDESGNRVLVFDFVSLPTTTLSNASTGSAYSATLSNENSQGTVSFSLVSGSLPAGLSLGSLSGTPTESGTFTFTAQATDDNGAIGSFVSNQRSYTLTVVGGGAVPLGPWLNPIPPSTTPSTLSQYNLTEGDTISSPDSNDPDVYIVNDWGYKRLFLNPVIFSFYGHLGGFQQVTAVAPSTRDIFPTSGLFRNCETNEQQVYAVEVTGEDVGILHHVALSGSDAISQDPDFFRKVFCINTNEENWYPKGDPYTSLNQVPVYVR